MNAAEKTDLKKEMKHLYSPSPKKPVIVDVPPMNFLMIDGNGNPNESEEYQQSMEALFGTSYTLKFDIRKSMGIDYTVMPLEGLWWAEDMDDFPKKDKDSWIWTSMIMQPEWVTEELIKNAIEKVRKKKELPCLDDMRFSRFDEGLSAQIMYVGPYADEGPVIDGLHRFIEENGCRLSGRHHEIYLSDPRRCAPEKLKTVIRQPVIRD